MTTTTSGSAVINLAVVETIALSSGAAANPTVTHGINSQAAANYNPNTTPVPDAAWSNTITLSGGALTLNLAALTRSPLATVDMTGLDILAIHVKAKSTNTETVSIVPGASNGYADLGLGQKLKPGCEFLYHCPNGAAVDSTHRTLDISSSDADAKLDIVIWASIP